MATPRLGEVRKNVSSAITSLVGSMADATDAQIKEALERLRRIEGSRANLNIAIEQCQAKAEEARSKIRELERHATEMEDQAATLQRVNEGGTPRSSETIAALQAELARRASRQADMERVEHGSVEETETPSFGEETFRSASYDLSRVLDQLDSLVAASEPELRQKRQVDDKKPVASRPTDGPAVRGPQSSRAEDKLAAHAAKYRQFKELAKEEKNAMKKWQAELARQQQGLAKPTGEVLCTESASNL